MTMTTALDMMSAPERVDGGAVAESHAIEIPVIDMVLPMPGFPEHRRWALVQVDGASDLCSFGSLDEPGLRFLVVPPAPFFPDYAPEVDDATAAELGLTTADDALVLLVLNAGQSLGDTTANLLAPFVINTATRQAAQIILDDMTLPVSAPLVA